MKILSEREQVRSVFTRFSIQYSKDSSQKISAVIEQLRLLDVENATADDVARIIGNKSWVTPAECMNCGCFSWRSVIFELEANSGCFSACPSCLRKALDLTDETPDTTAQDTKRILIGTVSLQSTMNKILKELKDKR